MEMDRAKLDNRNLNRMHVCIFSPSVKKAVMAAPIHFFLCRRREICLVGRKM
jgi:hypothetical protein